MKGEEIKDAFKKIKADNRLVEKIKQLENSEPKKIIYRSEFWGSLAAACWVLLIAIFLFKFIKKDDGKDPVLQNTQTINPIKTIYIPTTTKGPTATPTQTKTPKPTKTPTPTPTPEPFSRQNIDTKGLDIILPEGVTNSRNIDLAISKGDIYISIYKESSKLYQLYNINKNTGELKSVSTEVSNLKTGKEFCLI